MTTNRDPMNPVAPVTSSLMTASRGLRDPRGPVPAGAGQPRSLELWVRLGCNEFCTQQLPNLLHGSALGASPVPIWVRRKITSARPVTISLRQT